MSPSLPPPLRYYEALQIRLCARCLFLFPQHILPVDKLQWRSMKSEFSFAIQSIEVAVASKEEAVANKKKASLLLLLEAASQRFQQSVTIIALRRRKGRCRRRR